MLARRIATLLAALIIAATVHGQALPAATRGLSVQAGLGYSFASPDYSDKYTQGISAYADADFAHGLGVEIEYHAPIIITPRDIGETSFLGGVRYSYHKRRFIPYGKLMAGLGTFHYYQGYNAANSSQSYGMYAFGGGLDYRATEHITIRAIDAEYQIWPGFPPNGLSPIVYTIGAAYRIR
jgi:hypothetical protein